MTMFLFGMTAGAVAVLVVVFIVVKMNEKDEKQAKARLSEMCDKALGYSALAKWTAEHQSRRVDELASKVSNVEARTDNLLTYMDDSVGSHEALYHIPEPKAAPKKDKKK